MRKYICIAPFPPPIMGQSKVTLAVVDALYGSQFYKLDSNKSSLASGSFSFSRLTDLLKIFWRFFLIKKDSDTYTYHSVAESFLGNLRDLIIFFLNYRNLKRHYVHVLGGTSLRKIISSNSMKGSINRFFIKRLGGVIVEGSLNKSYFEKIIDSSKIHIIPNFVESYLFADDEIIKKKFQFDSNEKINILYLSNLIPGKGYVELANAFMELESSIRNNFNLYFVGGFESREDEINFKSSISSCSQITYLGKFIDHAEKRLLYDKTHIFCLPTYYPYEGLPIAILEAYASGCAVITTNHSIIPDVFSDSRNGFLVEKKSISSLKSCLLKVFDSRMYLERYAFFNRDMALQNFRIEKFSKKLREAFNHYA